MSISSIIENIEDRERDLESLVDNDHDDDGDEDEKESNHSDDNGDGGDDDDKTGKSDAEDDGDEDDEEERSASLSDEAKDKKRRDAAKARRQRRRANQHARDQRRDNYVRELEGTLENVAARLDQLEGRTKQQDDAGLERMIRNADAMIDNAKRELVAAQEASDHARVAQLIDDISTYKADKIRLTEAKAAREAEAHDETKEEKPGKKPNGEDDGKTQRKSGPDPIAVKNYGIFMKRNPLYRPDQPTNPITVAVHEIDTELTQEGWDPRTRDYWEEAEERARERGINLKDSKKSAAPRGERHSGDRSNGNKDANGGKGYTLSKARIDALKEAGLWDDPKKRAEMRARYERQDKEMNLDNRRRA